MTIPISILQAFSFFVELRAHDDCKNEEFDFRKGIFMTFKSFNFNIEQIFIEPISPYIH